MNAARIIFAAMLLSMPAMLCAQTTQPTTEIVNPIRRSTTMTSGEAAPASGIDAMRVTGALAAVIGLILVLRWCVRRLAPGGVGGSSRAVQILARCHVSHRQQILIVQAGRRLIVVGESAAGLKTLSEITDPDEVAVVLAQCGARVDAGINAVTSAQPRPAPQDARPARDDELELSFARQQLNGLAEKVRVVARQLNRA